MGAIRMYFLITLVWEQIARDAWKSRNPLEQRKLEPQVRPLCGWEGANVFPFFNVFSFLWLKAPSR